MDAMVTGLMQQSVNTNPAYLVDASSPRARDPSASPRSTPQPQSQQVIEGSNVRANTISALPPSVSPETSSSPNHSANTASQHQQFCLRWHNHQVIDS